MKIKRFLHVETDINGYNTVDVFATVEASREYAKEKLVEAVRTLLGSDYVIPDKDIDRDGYISHFPMGMKKPEISSSEWAWSVFDGDDQVVRGSVEEIEIELTEQETLDLYFAMEDSFRAEDAKHALFEYLGYQYHRNRGVVMAKAPVTIKQLWSFLFRIEQIEKRIQSFSGGQKYIEHKDLSQLSNIVESVRYGTGSLGTNL